MGNNDASSDAITLMMSKDIVTDDDENYADSEDADNDTDDDVDDN